MALRSLELLDALGSAWRGDWSDFDGRTLRDQLDDASEIIAREAGGEDVTREIAAFYVDHGICRDCMGWTYNCGCGKDRP